MNDPDGRIDDELRAAGAKWRSKRPTPSHALNPALFTATTRRPNAGRRALISAAGVLAVAVVSILVVVSLPPRDQHVATASQSPRTSASAASLPSSSPNASLTATDTTVIDGIAWKHIALGEPPTDTAKLASVQTINGAFFAYWMDCGDPSGKCDSEQRTYYPIVSRDGQTWTPLASVQISAPWVSFSYDETLGYVARAPLYSGPGAGLWHSTDGNTWEWLGGAPGLGDGLCPSQPVPAINAAAIYRSDSGVVLSGFAYCATTVADGSWTSTDGRSWTAASVPPVENVVVRNGMWLGTGAEGAWVSDNGLDWSLSDAIPSAAQLLPLATGLLAVLNDAGTHTMTILPDGGTWRGPLDIFHGSTLDAFSSDGNRAVVMEPTPNPNGPTAVWVSSVDGTLWARHPLPSELANREFLSSQQYQTTATLGDRLVALPNDNSLWVADIPTPSAPPAPNPTPSVFPATPSLSPTPIPTPRATLAPDAVGWVRQSDPGFGYVDSFFSSATNEGVTVVSGGLELEPNTKSVVNYPTTWRTTDGYNWQPSTFWPELQDRHYQTLGVLAYESGFVVYAVYSDGATGTEGTDIYLSADGNDWQQAGSIDGYGVTGMVAIRGRLVATTFDDSTATGKIFFSNDGASWQQSTEGVATRATAVAQDSADFYLTVAEADGLEVWTSTDGTSWSPVAVLPGAPAADIRYDYRTVVAHGSAGWSVVANYGGKHAPSRWYAWHSSDGVSWQQVQAPPHDVQTLTPHDGGFIAAGRVVTGSCCAYSAYEIKGITWTSADGVSWKQVTGDGWKANELDQLIVRDQLLVGLGIEWSDPDEIPTGTLWLANLDTFGQ